MKEREPAGWCSKRSQSWWATVGKAVGDQQAAVTRPLQPQVESGGCGWYVTVGQRTVTVGAGSPLQAMPVWRPQMQPGTSQGPLPKPGGSWAQPGTTFGGFPHASATTPPPPLFLGESGHQGRGITPQTAPLTLPPCDGHGEAIGTTPKIRTDNFPDASGPLASHRCRTKPFSNPYPKGWGWGAAARRQAPTHHGTDLEHTPTMWTCQHPRTPYRWHASRQALGMGTPCQANNEVMYLQQVMEAGPGSAGTVRSVEGDEPEGQ